MVEMQVWAIWAILINILLLVLILILFIHQILQLRRLTIININVIVLLLKLCSFIFQQGGSWKIIVVCACGIMLFFCSSITAVQLIVVWWRSNIIVYIWLVTTIAIYRTVSDASTYLFQLTLHLLHQSVGCLLRIIVLYWLFGIRACIDRLILSWLRRCRLNFMKVKHLLFRAIRGSGCLNLWRLLIRKVVYQQGLLSRAFIRQKRTTLIIVKCQVCWLTLSWLSLQLFIARINILFRLF